MPQCAGIKRDGGHCTVVVGLGATHCYAHDPRRAEERKRTREEFKKVARIVADSEDSTNGA
jgi:Papain-like cysteine protease AvrRpt2